MKQAYRWTALLGLSVLSACGGGGGSGGGGGTPPSTSYTIGGTITGLTTVSGLVLWDNGGDALTVPANATSFTFATAVPSGSGYAVTVHAQPSGETCIVSSGGGGTATADVTSVSISCSSAFAAGGSNVVPLTVEAGPADPADQTFNIPLLTSVKVCQGTTCATIPNVLVDTGSSGLRLMASVLTANGLTPTPMTDPSPGNGANTIEECMPYADGYTWGPVATVTVTIGEETTSTTIPVQIQVIDDSQTPPTPPTGVPQSCTSEGGNNSLNSVDSFDANGVLGVGTSDQDCGTLCTGANPAEAYYSCPQSGCPNSPTSLALQYQVANPVASFPVDNNGVILQLPSIPSTGAVSAAGYLVFGIGTEPNNGLGGATILTTDDEGDFTTLYTDLGGQAQTLGSSFIDSGSNGLYFPDSVLSESQNLCGASGTNGADFYCPTQSLNPPLKLSATNQGGNGSTTPVSFQIANLNDINGNYFAIDDVGGPAPAITGLGGYFDWGVPFFYSRTVYTAIEGATVGSETYANGFYAY